MLTDILIGFGCGILIGLLDNWLLFWKISRNQRAGREMLHGINLVFLYRYVVDAAALVFVAIITRKMWAVVAVAIAIVISVKVSLLIVYKRKGGRLN